MKTMTINGLMSALLLLFLLGGSAQAQTADLEAAAAAIAAELNVPNLTPEAKSSAMAKLSELVKANPDAAVQIAVAAAVESPSFATEIAAVVAGANPDAAAEVDAAVAAAFEQTEEEKQEADRRADDRNTEIVGEVADAVGADPQASPNQPIPN